MSSREGPYGDGEHGDGSRNVNIAEEHCGLLRRHPEEGDLYTAEDNETNELLGGHVRRCRERILDVFVAGEDGI